MMVDEKTTRDELREIKEQLDHIGRHVVSLIDHVAEVRSSNRRLEQRLSNTEEVLRAEITSTAQVLRTEIADTAEALRADIANTAQGLRTEIADTAASLRTEIADTTATLRAEMRENADRLHNEIREVGMRLGTKFDHFVEYFGEEGKRNRLSIERAIAEQKADRLRDDDRIRRLELRLDAIESRLQKEARMRVPVADE